MAFRSLSSLVPTADEILRLDLASLGAILLLHLKSYEGLSTVLQNGRINRRYFIAMLENRNVGLGPLPHKEPEYGPRNTEVVRAMLEAWNWLEREGMVIRDPSQSDDWFLISRRGEEFLKQSPPVGHPEADPTARQQTRKTKKPSRVFRGTFDDYTVVGQKGAGGSGTVFEVTDSTGKNLALKLLTNPSSSKVRRFKNELNFCSRSISKHIVQVLDSGRTPEGHLFYVMPLYSSTIEEKIRSGINPKEILGLFGQILDGVEAAHLLGVYHRDIKPANLLYSTQKNEVAVADFGIAHFQEEQLMTFVETESQERLGNFRYSAPEQRTPGATVDARADIFALGLILNEMFTGQVPQGSGHKKIQPIAPELAYLDPLVELMIRQEPGERPPSIRKVKEELIARGNHFVELQQLDSLKKEVVPESEVSDPLITDPIRAVKPEDYSNGVLTVRLNRQINEVWERCFRYRATSYSSNFSSAMVTFDRDKARIRVSEHFLDGAVHQFKQYCEAANEEYKTQVMKEHQKEIQRRRGELQRQIAEQEQKARILGRLNF